MTQRILRISVCVLCLAVVLPLAAQERARGTTVTGWTESTDAEERARLALVIGNGAYEHTDPLRNPPNDVRLIAAALEDVGFTVTLLVDGTRRQMDVATENFVETLDDAGRSAVGLFYYAGHAVSFEGGNWLLPVDANISNGADIKYESISSGWVLDLMESARNATDLLILDSCRNSPFRGFSLSGTRSLSAGLVSMDAPSGSFIAYSTAPGRVAYDGDGEYSPFADAFAAEIRSPGQSINDMMIEVTRRVKASTRDLGATEQVPWTHSSLDARFAFNPIHARTEDEPPTGTFENDVEVTIWRSIESSTDAAEFQAYLNQFPNGYFASIAKARLLRLGKASEDLQSDNKGSLNPPDAAPNFSVSTLEFRGIVNTATGVYSAPDRLSGRQRRLEVGATVRITGRVENRLWYRLELADGTVGYVSMSAVDRF